MLLYSQSGLKRILKHFPQSKFIVMLRNPVDAAVSRHGQNFKSLKRREREVSMDFEVCWRLLPERRNGKGFPKGCFSLLLFQYDLLYSYSNHLSSLFELVDKKRVHVILYDDFKKDVSREYKKACEFLCINSQFMPVFSVINQRAQLLPKTSLRAFVCLARYTLSLRKIIELTNTGLVDAYFKKHTVPFPDQKLSPRLLKEMKLFFREDIVKTSRLIDRDLSAWL